jgi:hypothetical protein
MRFRSPRFVLRNCFEGVDDNITSTIALSERPPIQIGNLGLIVPPCEHRELCSGDLSHVQCEENSAASYASSSGRDHHPRHAVDEDVDALVGAQDAPKQRFHVVLARVIDAQCDRGAAGSLDNRDGLIDYLGPPVRRWLAFDASTGAVDRHAGFTERTCDAAAGAARRSGHEGHASSERLLEGSLLCPVAGLARVALVVADFKGIRDG